MNKALSILKRAAVFLLLATIATTAMADSHWTVDAKAFQYSMTVYAGLTVDGRDLNAEAEYSNYEIAAFVGSECRGVAKLQSKNGNVWQYLRVYSNKADQEIVNFRVYDSYLNEEYMLDSEVSVNFRDLSLVGEPLQPYRFALTTISSQNSVAIARIIDAYPGRTLLLPVQLTNQTQLSGLQFDVHSQYPVSMVQGPVINQQRAPDHTVNIKNNDNGTFTVKVVSENNTEMRGNSGVVVSVPLDIPADAVVGDNIDIDIDNIVFTNTNGKNFVGMNRTITTLDIKTSNSPDLLPLNVSIRESEIEPEGTVNIDWLVRNIGTAEGTAGWVENIYLCNERGARAFIGTTRSAEILQEGGQLSRSATITLPANLNLDGEVYPEVEITCNPNMGEVAADQANNTARGNDAVMLSRKITLTADADHVSESSTQPVRFTLTRSGNRDQEEVFFIGTNETGLVSCDRQVIIPAGRGGVTFNVYTINNKVVNTADAELFIASNQSYPHDAQCSLIIDDDEFLNMELAFDREIIKEGEKANLTVTMARAEREEKTVYITCDKPNRFNFPTTVKVPAGETEVIVEVEAIDDNVADAEQVVDFYANASHYNQAKTPSPIVLQDNDIPAITLEITPAQISEDATNGGAIGIIRRTTALEAPITIRITDSPIVDDGEQGPAEAGRDLLYPQEVQFAAGQESVQFEILGKDNADVDGTRSYTMSAAVFIKSCNCQTNGQMDITGQLQGICTARIDVLDNDGPTLTATLSASTIKEGGETGTDLTITRNDVTAEPLTVIIADVNDSRIDLPHAIEIPANEASVTIRDLRSLPNSIQNDTQTLSIVVSAENHTDGSTWLMIVDETLPDAVITSFTLSTADKSQSGTEITALSHSTVEAAITVKNTGSIDIPAFTPIKIYLNGETEVATLETAAAIAPYESATYTTQVELTSLVGNATYKAVVNPEKTVKESVYINNTSNEVSVTVSAPYRAKVHFVKRTYQEGETMMISGEVLTNDRSYIGQQAEIYLYIDGNRISQLVEIDNRFGIFTKYTPDPGVTGHVTVGACYPGSEATEVQDEADIVGIRRVNDGFVKCEVQVGVPHNDKLKMENPNGINLTDINVEVLSKPDYYDIEFPGLRVIEAGATANLAFTLTSSDISKQQGWDEIKLRVTSAEGATYDMTVYAYSRDPRAQLKANINEIRTTMAVGQSRDIDFYLTNVGVGETGDITMLLPENAPWMKGVTPSIMSTMKTNEFTKVIIRLTANDKMKINQAFTGRIAFNCEHGNGITIPYYITPVSKSGGDLVVDVCDESTYYTVEKPHVKDAKVEVRNVNTNALITESTTGADGHANFSLPEGKYKLFVSAEDHNNYEGTVTVAPDTTTFEVVNLGINVVKISWEMKETEIEDRYEINSIMQYTTVVPAPVIKTAFTEVIPVDLIYQQGYAICNAVVTNVGLIKANSVVLSTEPSPYIKVEMLGENGFELMPHQVRNVPLKLTFERTESGNLPLPFELDCTFKGKTKWTWGLEDFTNGSEEKWSSAIRDCLGGDGSGGGGGGDTGGNGIGEGPGGGWPEEVTTSEGGEEGVALFYTCNELVKVINEVAADLVSNQAGFQVLNDEDKVLVNSANGKWDEVSTDAFRTMPALYKMNNELGMYTKVDNIIRVWNKLYEDFQIDLSFIGGKDGLLLESDAALKNTLELMDRCVKVEGVPTYVNAYMKALLRAAAHSRLAYIFYKELYGLETPIFVSKEQAADVNYFINEVRSGVNNGMELAYLSRRDAEQIINRIESLTETQCLPDLDKLRAAATQILRLEDDFQADGYTSAQELMNFEFDHYTSLIRENTKNAVCASITLKISQTLSLTRQAFNGYLTVTNGHATRPMRDVKVSLKITDEDGNCVGEDKFAVEESEDGPTGFHVPLIVNARQNAAAVNETPDLEELMNSIQSLIPNKWNNGQNQQLFEVNSQKAPCNIYETKSNWQLEHESTGQFVFTFIPTKNAAPKEPKRYTFGGTITYVNPFDNQVITRDFYPVTMTVSPTPELDLTYFMQRDIMGDNALTEDVVEPMIPSEFAVLINNVGAGDAKNVNIVTKQPEIIENKLGLLIDFEILSSMVNGKNKTMALGASVPSEFGTIAAGKQSYAQWELQCSLLGHFVNYKVEATHLTSRDNPDLSLLRNVTIHELIHSVDAFKNDKVDNTMYDENGKPILIVNARRKVNQYIPPSDGLAEVVPNPDGDGDDDNDDDNGDDEDAVQLKGWLVNDIPDDYDRPDAIYLSDGTVEDLKFIEKKYITTKTLDYRFVELTVHSNRTGWVYGNLPDPTGGSAGILSITRKSDGKKLPVRNFWQTEWTVVEVGDPIQENILHFADNMCRTLETYIIEYEPHPGLRLAVEKLEGPDPVHQIEVEPLKDVYVKFNKPIEEETFTYEDLKVTLGGKQINVEEVYIANQWRNDESYYHIAFDKEVEDNGYYTVTVRTDSIMDNEGFWGKNGKCIGWTLFKYGLVSLDVIIFPENAGTVTQTSGANNARSHAPLKVAGGGRQIEANYGDQVILTATPNVGYEFVGWYQGEQLLSTQPTYVSYSIDNATIKAKFQEKKVNLMVEYREGGGSINGGGSGIYPIGTELELRAVAADRNAFTGWKIGNRIISKDATLRYTLNEDTRLEAEFVREGGQVGDVNVDGFITVSDVVALSNLLLENDIEGASIIYADVNDDNELSVSDIPGIVNILFDNDAMNVRAMNARLAGGDVKVNDMEAFAGMVTRHSVDYTTTYSGITGMQMDILLPEGFELVATDAAEGASNHIVAFNKLRSGYTRVLCYSMDNTVLTDGSILSLAVKTAADVKDGVYEVPVKGIILATTRAAGRHLTDQKIKFVVGNATNGIDEVKTDGSDGAIYDLTGRKLNSTNAATNGIYIQNNKKQIKK